jgi:hypothetical protein
MARAALWAALVASALWVAPQRAMAQPNARRVVVWAEGPDAKRAQADVAASLDDRFEVVDSAGWRDSMARDGQRGPLLRALRDPKRRAELLERARRVATTLQIDDVVLVSTSRARTGAHVADGYVVDGSQGPSEPIHVSDTRIGSLGAPVRERLRLVTPQSAPADAAPAVATRASAAAPSPPPSPVAEPSSEPELSPPGAAGDRVAGSSERPVHVVAREWFEVSLGGGVGARHFEYNDGFTNDLRDYHLAAAPLAAIEGELYPLADQRIPILRDIGVVGSYSQAFALQSNSAGAGAVGTRWTEWQAGGRLRLRTGGDAAPVVGLSGSYGSASFAFDSSNPTAALPSVSYRYVRAGADFRMPLWRFAVTAGGGYLGVLSAGDVASRFPHASVAGVDASLGGAFDWGWGIETRMTARYGRFFYAMNSTPGDRFVAGGALDEMMGLELSLAYVY